MRCRSTLTTDAHREDAMRYSVLALCLLLIGCVGHATDRAIASSEVTTTADAKTVQAFAREFQRAAPLICKNEVCISELRLEATVNGLPSELAIRLERNAAHSELSTLTFHFFSQSEGSIMMTDAGLNGSVDVFVILAADDTDGKISYTLTSCFDQMDKTTCGAVEDQFTANAKDDFYGHAVTNFLRALLKVNAKRTSI